MKAVVTCHRIGDLFPMCKIPAVEDRNSRIQFKAGIYQIKILSHTADGRIRIKTRDNRILNFSFLHHKFLLYQATG